MTSSSASSSSAEFFDAKYRERDDPWAFATDDYEQRRYACLLEHIPAGRYASSFEPGCSVGVLTEQLGERCATVVATDHAETAVYRARERCARLPGVRVLVGDVIPPTGPGYPVGYDLVVFSEIGYYLERDELASTLRAVAERVRPGGRFAAAHWLGTSPDHVLHGRDVHEEIAVCLAGWNHRHHAEHADEVRDGFVLDVWDRP